MKLYEQRSKLIYRIMEAALQEVDSYKAVSNYLELESDVLKITTPNGVFSYELKSYDNVYVVGFGKASANMALAVEDILGEWIRGGLVIVKHGHLGAKPLQKIQIMEASHPEPDESCVEACSALEEILKNAGAKDLVLALISGGGSALCTIPAGNLGLEDIKGTTRELLGSGANIHEMNYVRKKISAFKGGEGSLKAYPATVAALVISDVIGDDLGVISSGPFFPDSGTHEEALDILFKYNIASKVPVSVIDHLRTAQKAPLDYSKAFRNVRHFICASNKHAIEAAKLQAEMCGFRTFVFEQPLQGDVVQAAQVYMDFLNKCRGQAPKSPVCCLAGGETTVKLMPGHGVGGRNQQFALKMAELLKYYTGINFASIGTDGTDGPTDAAGAMVNSFTNGLALQKGISANEYLKKQDAYHFFEKVGGLIKTGPTNTNVMDIQIALVS